MKIKKEGKNLVVLTDNKTIYILRDSKSPKNQADIIIDLYNVVPDKANHILSAPGEYEVKDILLNIFSIGKNLDLPEVVSIDSDENIKLLVLVDSVVQLDKNIIDKLPDTNVLIMEMLNGDTSKKLQIVNDLEPEIFMPWADKGVEMNLSKDLGVKEVEEIGTLNLSSKDFTEESSELKVYFLK